MGDFEKVYNAALKFLSYRPRSEKEIRDRLELKSQNSKVKNTTQNSKVIDEVIKKLKKQKFIDDEEFVNWWIEQRLAFKPRSLRLIKFELMQKGISEEAIENIIHDSKFMIQSDLEQAKRLLDKKMGRSRNKFGMTPERLGRFLAAKGFDWETIKKAIDETLKEEV